MPIYRVSAVVIGSKYIGEFEAESVEEAKEMAWESDELFISLCHSCSGECEDAEVTELNVDEEDVE